MDDTAPFISPLSLNDVVGVLKPLAGSHIKSVRKIAFHQRILPHPTQQFTPSFPLVGTSQEFNPICNKVVRSMLQGVQCIVFVSQLQVHLPLKEEIRATYAARPGASLSVSPS